MRLIVFSDTHGNVGAADKIVQINPISDHFLFVGDGLKEMEVIKRKYPEKHFYCVAGNIDPLGTPTSAVVELFGIKIFMAHGHLLGVREGIDTLMRRASEEKPDVVLFGHTHCRFHEVIGGVHVLNPGSASQPKDGLPPSYAFIDVNLSGVGCVLMDLPD